MAKRARHFRAVRIKLECGHLYDANTGRYRVSEALASCIFGDYIRKGCWCFTCNACCQPVKILGVVRDD